MLIVIGMASLGALIGLLAAWSASPIAVTALPLIVGLVGGASGYSVVKMDVTQPSNVAKLNLLGQTLTAFSLACILGVAGGIWIEPTLGAFRNQRPSINMTGQTDINTIVSYLVLRKKLELVGASEDEIANLLSLVEQSKRPESDLEAASSRLDGAISIMNPQFETPRAHSESSHLPAIIEVHPPRPTAD
jgi:hypothetical protein